MRSSLRASAMLLGAVVLFAACSPRSQQIRTQPPDMSACAAPIEEFKPADSREEFISRFVGVWLLCSRPSFFGTDEDGLELDQDGRWWMLSWTNTEELVRQEGWGRQGSWEVIDTSTMNPPGHYHLNLSIDAAGTAGSFPQYGAQATRMRLNNSGVYIADYVRTSHAAATTPEEHPAAHEVSAECTAPEGGVARISSKDEFVRRIVGSWLICKGPTFFETNEKGLEISLEGRWWKLNRTDQDELFRLEGEGNEGVWEVAVTGSDSYQLIMEMKGRGGWYTHPFFALKTSKMRLTNPNAADAPIVADYVKARS